MVPVVLLGELCDRNALFMLLDGVPESDPLLTRATGRGDTCALRGETHDVWVGREAPT
jgi:hypothetical protein